MSKYITRYGSMRLLGVLATRSEDQYTRGDRVVVRTNRGLETGEVLREASENAIKQMKNPSNGQILRSSFEPGHMPFDVEWSNPSKFV